jgi:hypothetical protein
MFLSFLFLQANQGLEGEGQARPTLPRTSCKSGCRASESLPYTLGNMSVASSRHWGKIFR